MFVSIGALCNNPEISSVERLLIPLNSLVYYCNFYYYYYDDDDDDDDDYY